MNKFKEMVAAFLRRAADYFNSKQAKQDLLWLTDYVPKAIPIIDMVASIAAGITPTKMDDAAVLWAHSKYPKLFDGSLKTAEEMLTYLLGSAAGKYTRIITGGASSSQENLDKLGLATDLMRVGYPSLSVSQARAAVQVAYVGVKADEKAEAVNEPTLRS
jgi:hypothetical protein